MSDIDPTPTTPVTIGDRLAWWRDELRQALTALRSDENWSLRGIANTVTLAYMNIQGTGNKTLTHVDDRLSTLQDTVYDGLYIQGDVANYPAHIRLNAELESISERLDYIQAALGAQPYESLELASVRGLLQALLSNAAASTYGLAPITKDGDKGSVGDIFVDGRLYAFFDEPPGANITVNEAGITLTSVSWDGWAVYIQTADPEPLENTSVAPANKWYNLTGSGSKSWSVKQQYTIKVTLRPPVGGTETWYTSQLIRRLDNRYYQRILMSQVPWLTSVAVFPGTTSTARNFELPIYISPNQYIYARLVSGPPIRVWRYTATGVYTLIGLLPSQTETFYHPTEYITFQPATDTQNLATTFTIGLTQV